MPRPERPDLRPLICVREDGMQARLYSENKERLTKRKRIVRVYKTGQGIPPWEEYHQVFDVNLRERLDAAAESGVFIDEGLLHRMFGLLRRAEAAPAPEKPIENDGEDLLIPHRLNVVGSRIEYSTLEELMKLLHVPRSKRSKLEEQIARLKEFVIVVNWGERPGWLEFDCDLVWKGSRDLREAYRKVQKVHPSWSPGREYTGDVTAVEYDHAVETHYANRLADLGVVDR